MSAQNQVILIKMLLPEIYTVMVDFFNELNQRKTLGSGVESLLFTASASIVSDGLKDQETKEKAISLCGNARRLFGTLPFLKRNPTVAFNLLQSADFGVSIEAIRIDLGSSFQVSYNRFQPLLHSNTLNSQHEKLDWALKFLRLALQKRLLHVAVYFSADDIDEEFKHVQESFLEQADKIISEEMKDSGHTYVRSNNNFPRRVIHFNKMTLYEADQYLWLPREPVQW